MNILSISHIIIDIGHQWRCRQTVQNPFVFCTFIPSPFISYFHIVTIYSPSCPFSRLQLIECDKLVSKLPEAVMLRLVRGKSHTFQFQENPEDLLFLESTSLTRTLQLWWLCSCCLSNNLSHSSSIPFIVVVS